jgi:DNA-binding CsgD family transcriptional regulator
MAAIRDAYGSLLAALLIAAPDHRPIVANAGLEASAQASYRAYYGALDPVADRFQRPQTPLDVALPGAAFASWPERRRHEFFADWAAPAGMGDYLVGTAFQRKGTMNWLVVAGHAGQRRLASEANIQFLRRILPHVRRAAELQLRLGPEATRLAEALDVLALLRNGVLLVSSNGCVFFLNPAAEAIVAAEDGLCLDRGGRLVAETSRESILLHRLITLATTGHGGPGSLRSGGKLTLSRSSGRRHYILHVVPLSGETGTSTSALIVAIDLEHPAGLSVPELRDLFGLTTAEALTTQGVVRGVGLQHVADQAGVTLSTIRTQLQHVFEKTGTGRQAELTWLLTSVDSGIAHGPARQHASSHTTSGATPPGRHTDLDRHD